MTVRLVTPTAGPTLVRGDCLTPVVTLCKDDTGEVYGTCPTCGDRSTDATAPGGAPMHAQLFEGTAYGIGVLVPCGHEIGGICAEGEAAA